MQDEAIQTSIICMTQGSHYFFIDYARVEWKLGEVVKALIASNFVSLVDQTHNKVHYLSRKCEW